MAELTRRKAEFETADIVIVSFGPILGARRWLEETSCPFQMLLDKDRVLYKYVGLLPSLLKTWSVAGITYYAEQIAQGRPLPKPNAEIKDDPQQMGGDFVIGENGHFLLVHCSKTPMDRPSIDKLKLVLLS